MKFVNRLQDIYDREVVCEDISYVVEIEDRSLNIKCENIKELA
jgi:sporulation protein YlmC with PRC-barrel domain